MGNKNITPYLRRFLSAPKTDLFEIFSKFNNYLIKESSPSYIYVPGTRSDRVLLVAHMDTVWSRVPRIIEENGVIKSGNLVYTQENDYVKIKGTGIGADDRAGVAMAYALSHLGHSILITDDEESGCVGAIDIMQTDLAYEIERHSFAVELDRRDRSDIVFYNGEPKEFRRFAVAKTGYAANNGTYTDIVYLCQNMCSFNISVGYRNEHKPNEILVINWWRNTFNILNSFLSEEQKRWNLYEKAEPKVIVGRGRTSSRKSSKEHQDQEQDKQADSRETGNNSQ